MRIHNNQESNNWKEGKSHTIIIRKQRVTRQKNNKKAALKCCLAPAATKTWSMASIRLLFH